MKHTRVIVDINELEGHLIECGIYQKDVINKILQPLKERAAVEYERIRVRRLNIQHPAHQYERPAEIKNEVPELNWDKMPLLMSKTDISRYLDLPDKLVLQWIKEGKIHLRKRIGMRPYALTEELKKAFPSLYNELKQDTKE